MPGGSEQLTPRQAARRRNPEISARVGANIRRARLAAGLSQGQLARLVDDWTDGSSVSRWERGVTRPLESKLVKLAEVLGVPDSLWFFQVRDDEQEEAA